MFVCNASCMCRHESKFVSIQTSQFSSVRKNWIRTSRSLVINLSVLKIGNVMRYAVSMPPLNIVEKIICILLLVFMIR